MRNKNDEMTLQDVYVKKEPSKELINMSNMRHFKKP